MDIEYALKILLTPDGVGIKTKAVVLTEVCEQISGNLIRDATEKYVKEKSLPKGPENPNGY